MNPNTLLIDFNADELAFAIVAIKESRETAIHMLAKHEVIGTDPEHESVRFWEKQQHMACLWETQLYMALAQRKAFDTINAN